jgi:hypothetical protein
VGDEDPVPIRRVLLRPAQLAEELERVRRGVLLQMPRAEFDALIHRASAAIRAGQSSPALVETRYQATLTGDALFGTANWRILAAGSTPALLAVEPLQLAVRNARWTDDRAAVLGDLDPRQKAPGAELLVERPGEQTLALQWSARGVPEPGGVRFDLRLPSCAVATLDLELPPGFEPMCQRDGCLVTGPTPAAAPDRRAWQILFGGASQLELVIRPPAEAGPQPLVLVRQQNVQELSPGQAVCDYSLDLDVRHGGVRELRLEYDPALRPIDVAVRNLARWHILEGDEETPNQIAIEFSEPFRGGAVTVRGVGPIGTNRAWVSPWIRVAGGVPRGEQITIRVHPELAYRDWKPGSFRLLDVAASADRTAVWTLQGGAVRAAPNRPSARFRLHGPEYQVRQRLWWHVGPGGETLTAQCRFDVRRGPVFQVPFSVPADWTVQHVDSMPAEALAGWSVVPPAVNGGSATLTAEFLHPLVPDGTTQLQMTLVRSRREPLLHGSLSLTAPDVRPLSAAVREGTLGINVEPEYQASWTGAGEARSTFSTVPAEASAPPPWGPAAAGFVFDLGPHAVAGKLLVRPLPSRYRARGRTTVSVVGRQARVIHRLALEPLTGSAETVLVRTSANDNSTWAWRVVSGNNRVRGVQPVDLVSAVARAGLGTASPLAAVIDSGTANRRGEVLWAVNLERPLTEPVELQAHADLILPPAGNAARAADWLATLAADKMLPSLSLAAAAHAAGEWPLPVPLMSFPGAAGSTSTVTVDLTAAHGVGLRTSGLTELPTSQTSTYWRRFTGGAGPVALWLSLDGDASRGLVSAATLWTDISEPDHQAHYLRLRLQDWSPPSIVIGLPNDAIVQRVLTDGAIAPAKWPVQSADGLKLTITLPRAGPEVGLDVIFSTPQSPWRIASRLHTPVVRLPGATSVRRVWHFPPGVVPVGRTSEPSDHGAAAEAERTPGDNRAAVWVVRESDVTAVGLVLAAAIVIGVALAGPRSRVMTIAVASVAGLSVIWLPGPLRPAACWPFVAALFMAAGTIRPIRGDARHSHRALYVAPSSSRGSVVVGMAIVACLAASGRAAAPAPATVFLVAGPDGEISSVLVPPDLAEQLRELERSGVAALDGARVTAARYAGQVDGPVARWQGGFEVHSFSDGPTSLSLPLAGVVLRDAQLDGAPAYPRAAGDRYTVVVRGRGRHVLDLNFQTPISGTDEDNIRFAGPEAVQSSLSLDLPAGARLPHVVVRRGGQTVTDANGRPRLEADLGRAAAVHARWQTAAAETSAAAVGVHEAYLWDISGAGAILHGALRFTIGGGSVTTLSVELPKDLLVAAVTARPLDAAPSGAPAGWLRRWHTTTHDHGSRLTLDFGTPISGNWQIALGLVPRAPWPAAVTLSFPAADAKKTTSAAYAYRARELAVSLTRTTGVAPLAEDAFFRDHWLPAQVEADPPPPTRAFQRSGGGVPSLRVSVAPVTPQVSSIETWSWRVGPESTEVRADSRVSAQSGVVSLIEWEVPATVRVLDLRGPDVANWTQTGGRLQVWLRRRVAETTIQWTGTVGRPAAQQSAPAAATATRFDLPVIRPVAMSFRGTVNIGADAGWLLTPLQTTHLRTADAVDGSRHAGSYVTESPAYQAAFQIRPAAMDDEFRLTTVAGLRDGSLHADTTVETAKGHLTGATLVVTARAAAKFQYRVNAPGARVREVAAAVDRRLWTVDWPAAPEPAQPPRINVLATAAASAFAADDRPPEWILPHIDIEVGGRDRGRVERTVTLETGLAAAEVHGLKPTSRPNTWAVVDDSWHLSVRPAVGPQEADLQTSAVEVLRGNDGKPFIRLTCQVAVPPGTNLRWVWPRPVRVLSANVDDGRLVPPSWQRQELEFAVDDRTGYRTIVFEWIPDTPQPWDAQRLMPRVFSNGGSIDVPVRNIGRTGASPSGATPPWLLPLSRTALLIGLLAGGVWWSRRYGDAGWPVSLVVLGGVGWTAAGGWYWLLPIGAGVLARATIMVRTATRRRATTSSAALSSWSG